MPDVTVCADGLTWNYVPDTIWNHTAYWRAGGRISTTTETALLNQRAADIKKLDEFYALARRANRWGTRRAEKQIRELAAMAPRVQDPALDPEPSP